MKKEKKEKTINNLNLKIIIPILLIIIIAIIAITTILFSKNKPNKPNTTEEQTNNQEIKYNTNKNVIENKSINNIKFTNIECTYDGNNSLLTYTITNTGNEKINLSEYEIVVKDKEGNILTNLAPNLDFDLEPNQPYDTGNAVNIDISTANSIEIKLN